MSGSQHASTSQTDARKLQILSRGDLDAISKPSLSKAQSGSKPPGSGSRASCRSRDGSGLPSHLQLLSPEEVLDNDYDLVIQDYGDSGSESDSEEDGTMTLTGRTSSLFGIPEPLTDRSRVGAAEGFETDRQSEEEYMAIRQLALLENESEDFEVCSDEERDIMAEIRAEITQKVREDMKSELEVYRQAHENLDKDGQPKQDTADLEGLEPKLRDAILKMRKLDKILLKKMKREKEVKRDRIRLQKRLREELDSLKSDGQKSVTADETRNTERFMLLALPPSHNSGISVENPDEDDPAMAPVTPVFQTQVPDDQASVQSQQDTGGRSTGISQSEPGSGASQSGASSVSGASSKTTDSSGKRVRKKKSKDFIKRNIQLASDAGNAIAMTDDEKKRIEDLLCDLDTLPEIPEDFDPADTPSLFEVAVPSGDGFLPSQDERLRMQHIDSRLKMLLPPDDFLSISSGSVTSRSDRGSMLFTRTHFRGSHAGSQLGSHLGSHLGSLQDDLDLGDPDGDPGEHALRLNKDDRLMREKLKDIEIELDQLSSAVDQEMKSPKLTEEQLNHLLDDCARTMSRVTMETNSLASSTSQFSTAASQEDALMETARSRSSLYENPPHLPRDVLDRLLHEAERDSGRSVNNGDLVLQSLSEESVRDSQASTLRPESSRPTSRGTIPSPHLYTARASPKPSTPLRPPSGSTRQPSLPAGGSTRQPFLPEIDPKGRLSTQRLNNQRLNNEADPSRDSARSLSEVYTVRNSLKHSAYSGSDTGSGDLSSDQSDDVTPHPPAAERKGSGSRPRTKSPFT